MSLDKFRETRELDPKFDTRAKCSNPACQNRTEVRGEPCKSCYESQERMRRQLRAQKGKR